MNLSSAIYLYKASNNTIAGQQTKLIAKAAIEKHIARLNQFTLKRRNYDSKAVKNTNIRIAELMALIQD